MSDKPDPGKITRDPEIKAISTVGTIMESLSEEARRRLLDYLNSRYGKAETE